jgi:4-hydroxybenzoate polyprenyltransferase
VVSRRAVLTAAIIAVTGATVACYVINPVTGTINAIMLLAGWAYNAGLKATLASGLMYVVGFGLIPAFAVSVLPGAPWPSPWTVAAAALLGLGGHFANVLPDLAGDRASGTGGLPQRLAASRGGPLAVRLAALVLLLTATGLIGLARVGWWPALAGLGLATVLAVAGAFAPGRLPFYAAIGIAVLDTVLLVAGGVPLVG